MKIDVKFSSSELAEKLRSGEYDVPDDCTVDGLIDTASHETGFKISDELKDNLVFLYNNRHAAWDTPLSGGGKLRVLHKVLGG